MTNKKSTKKALLMSALSLLLCFSMLVGTTFAWFTDSVSTANNIITAGNLDVNLQWSTDGKTWADVKSDTNVFLENTKWEPGHTEVVYLKVQNLGSLALKYNLGINIDKETTGTNVAGESFKLSDYILYNVLPGIETYANSAAARGDETGSKLNTPYNNAATLESGKEISLTVVVFMPTTVGNEANFQTGTTAPSINLGINLFATQQMKEEDSYGDEYDAAAPWTGIIPASLEETTIEIVPGGGTQTGTITINSAEDLVYLSKLAKEWVSLYTNGQGTDVEKYYVSNGGKGTDYYYHGQWTLELTADLDMSNIPMDSVDISYWGSFNGNGHTISNIVLKNGQRSLFNKNGYLSNLTVKNIVVNAPAAQHVAAVAYRGSMNNVHVVNATVNGGKYVGGLVGYGSNFVNCSVKNSTITGSDKTVGGLVGYASGDPGIATISGNTVENVTVTGTYNVGGLLGQAQNVKVENNTIKNVTVKSTIKLPAGASSNEVRTAEVAARSAFAGTTIGTNTVENVTLINFENISNAAELKDVLSNAASAGAGDTAIYLAGDIDLTGTTWTPINVDGYNGADIVTIEGNGATITGLTAPLFAGGFAGGSGIVIKDLTIADSNIVSSNTIGSGAFIESVDSMAIITLENCHLVNSTVTGGSGSRTGGLIGWTAGYSNVNDGPVKTYVNITNCSVIGCTITCDGSVGGIYGHAGNNDWTYSTIEDCIVKDCKLISTDDGGWRVGVVVGTANVGEVTINNITESGNTLTQTGKTAPAGQSNLYGRFVPVTTGKLVIDGVAVH